MSSALLQIELEIKDRLESFAFFDGLDILVDPRKNLIAEIQSRIARLKTLIAPKIVAADDNNPNVHGVYFDDIRISVGVVQNPILKADHPEPWEICEEIHKALKNWTPASLSNALNPIKPGIEAIPDAQLNIYNCNFATKGGFLGALPTTAAPVITQDELTGLVSISCLTLGAAIFYSNTTPNTGSEIYTEPFLPAASPIKARAYRPGYLASTITTFTPTIPD